MSKKHRRPRRSQATARRDNAPVNESNAPNDDADSSDEFLGNKDKISLEDDEPESKRRKVWREEDEILELSDEEVLGPTSETDLSSDEEPTRDTKRDDGFSQPNRRQSPASIGSKPGDDAEDDLQDGLEHWGSSRRDYYNQDDIEDEADALEEEEEAKRLQQKRLEGMSAADFGFDDNEWLDGGTAQDGKASDMDVADQVVTEVLPQMKITDAMGVDEKMELLNRAYPEFGPLAKELLSLQTLYATLRPAPTTVSTHGSSSQVETTFQSDDAQNVSGLPISTLKYQALAAYLGALTMYFALLTSTSDAEAGTPAAMPPSDLRDHPIMENLLGCRQLWEKLKDVRTPDPPRGPPNQSKMQKVIKDSDAKKKEMNPQPNKDPSISKRASKRERAREAREAIQSESARQQVERSKQMQEELDRVTATTKSSRAVRPHEAARNTVNGDSDLGEEVMLDASEAAEKARKKKTLRFYTSQITQKASRRDQAGKDAGGDTDLPYRERLKDRQARLNEQAGRRGKKEVKGDATAADLAVGSDEEDEHQKNEKRIDSDEEYYQLIASNTQKRKLAKAQKASAGLGADMVGQQGGMKVVEEVVGPDGKRAIGYVIEKNKGLAPKRNKDVRNPRVKKRKKYAEKQKKLASIRQVYKGGEQRGGYGGEATGIKARLVKSVKL
ncbi:MAG: hypothetical protein M1816_005035 [Peltula sp. TS41687]|nr:MAG: hypothetical protein M1816_005035 [Peltula sp. TS41687]